MLSPAALEHGHFIEVQTIHTPDGSYLGGESYDGLSTFLDAGPIENSSDIPDWMYGLLNLRAEKIKDKNLSIRPFNPALTGDSEGFGIFRNDVKIFTHNLVGQSLYDCTGSFRVKLSVSYYCPELTVDRTREKKFLIFEGMFYGDILTFVKEVERPPKVIDSYQRSAIRDSGRTGYVIERYIDFIAMINTIDPNWLDFAVYRLDQLESTSNVMPVPISGYSEEGTEFLAWDDREAGGWGGPIRHNRRVGCVAHIFKRKVATEFPGTDVLLSWISQSDFSRESSRNFEGVRKWSALNSTAKVGLLMSIPIAERNRILSETMRLLATHIETDLPYSVYLAGNDDCSMTRYFSSCEAAEFEMQRLRNMQPLQFKDLRDSGYVFTN